MNKTISFLVFLILGCYFINATERPIQMHKKGAVNNHSGQPLFPADQPAVYYDDVAQQIIIDGTGEASYYDVEINSLSTFDLMLNTQVNGSYATIDVASLPDDDYEIVITSSLNNVFEGYFTNY